MAQVPKNNSRILLVGNNGRDNEQVRKEFKRKSDLFLIDVSKSCGQARRRIAAGASYDFVFVDLGSSDDEGLRFISFAKNISLQTRVVAVTGSDDGDRVIKALKAGADDFVVKTNGYQEELLKCVNRGRKNSAFSEDANRGSGDETRKIRVLYATRRNGGPDLVEEYLDHFASRISLELVESIDGLTGSARGEACPDILLLDYDLVGPGIFHLVKTIRERPGHRVPIVIAASPANEEDAAQTIKLGADDYIVKDASFIHRLPRVVENAFFHSEIAYEKERLKKREERYRIISGLVSHYAYVFDVSPEGKLIGEWYSASFENRFGYSLSEIEARGGWQSLAYEEDISAVADHVEKILEGKYDRAEFRLTTRTGEPIWIRDYAEAVWDPLKNRVVKIYGASQDLTEQKTAESELHRAESRLMEVADSLPQPLIEVDIFGKVTFANRVAFEFMGADQEDFDKGSYLFDFVSPEDYERAIESFRSILRGEKIEPRQYTIVRKDRTTRRVLVSATQITSGPETIGVRIVLLDMTDVNTFQEAVKASESRYRLLFENSADELFIVSEDGTFLQVNRAATEKLGYSREEILGQKTSEILPETVRGEEESHATQILISGEATYESLHRRKDGGIIPVEVHGRSIVIDEEKTILLAARDLTERKKAEAAIRESEEKFKNLVESSLVGVYIIQDGKFAYVNPALSRIFGYTRDELVALPSIAAGIVTEDRKRVLERMKLRLETATESIKYSFRVVRKDREIIQVETLGSRTLYEGRPAIIGTLEDVTETRKAEERLRESEARYRDLFENSVDAIYLSTPDGRMLDINPAGVRLFGFSSKEEMLKVDDVSELYENKEERDVFRRTLEARGLVRDFEVKIRRKDGQNLTVLDTASVVLNERGEVESYHGILRDLTEKRRLEEQLFQSQKLESLGQLTSGIAHDFNNVLGGIMGFTELAIEKMEDDKTVHDYLAKTYSLAERAVKITRQLLAFARRQILMPKDINLNEMIGDLFELLPRLLGEHVETSFIPGKDLKTVRADPAQLEQVLLNLAVNASDAMPNGGKLVIETDNAFLDESYCITHPNVQPGEHVTVSVSDTGSGIEPSTLQHIFEPFFTTKAVGKGTGLGLAVVHGIIQQHGGSINVYSEPGKGTTFKLYFPAIPGAAVKLNAQSKGKRRLMSGTETVLVVEDNDELREFMRRLLVDHGYTVLTAGDGEEGQTVFEKHSGQISLVVTDVLMPKMNGRELREKILADHPDMKFILISGYPGHAINHGFLLDSRVDFLQKPFTAFDFAEKVRRTIDKSA